jgi:hypothetical protein
VGRAGPAAAPPKQSRERTLARRYFFFLGAGLASFFGVLQAIGFLLRALM